MNKKTLKLEYSSDDKEFKLNIEGTTNNKLCKNNQAEIMNTQIKILYEVIFKLSELRMDIISKKDASLGLGEVKNDM